MSAFIFVLILVTLAQCRAKISLLDFDLDIDSPSFGDIDSPSFGDTRAIAGRQRISKMNTGGILVQAPIGPNLAPLYTVISQNIPDNSIEAQQNICPGFRPIRGAYLPFTDLCQENPALGIGIYVKFMGLTDDPAPEGNFTVVTLQFRDRVSCEQNGEIIETSFAEEEIYQCDGNRRSVFFTKIPVPPLGASLLGLPKEVLEEVQEGSQLLVRHDSPRGATCTLDRMLWYTTGICLNTVPVQVVTFDNYQVFNANFYTDASCTTQSTRSSVSFPLNQCVNASATLSFILGNPIIYEGVSSESSESSESIEDSPGLGAVYTSNAEESGDTDGVSTTVKAAASISACVLFVAAVAMYFKGRYCFRKESQETNLNLDDVAVVIA